MLGFKSRNSAQSYMADGASNADKISAGSSCGAGGDKPEPKPSACGSSCGAGGDKPEPKPSACGAGGDK